MKELRQLCCLNIWSLSPSETGGWWTREQCMTGQISLQTITPHCSKRNTRCSVKVGVLILVNSCFQVVSGITTQKLYSPAHTLLRLCSRCFEFREMPWKWGSLGFHGQCWGPYCHWPTCGRLDQGRQYALLWKYILWFFSVSLSRRQENPQRERTLVQDFAHYSNSYFKMFLCSPLNQRLAHKLSPQMHNFHV